MCVVLCMMCGHSIQELIEETDNSQIKKDSYEHFHLVYPL